MSCIYNKTLHKKQNLTLVDSRYLETEIHCPALNQQLCLWCCLHICDITNPRNRATYLDKYETYSNIINEDSRLSNLHHNWDEFWHVCEKCQRS